jgi:NAD(P)-dependent dehydrogenase (short-subunit alcohol dehydrogenase family)
MAKRRGGSLLLWTAAGIGLGLALRSNTRKRMRMDFHGKVVVITGGSRGLGLTLARRFAEEGARLAVLAQDAGELKNVELEMLDRDAEAMTVLCDVRDPSEVESALARIVRRYDSLDVLINTAGIIQVGPLDLMTLEDFQDAMAVHFWGPYYTMRAAVPYMLQQGGGRIANISSIGGKAAVPHLAPYAASKFALTGLSDAFRAELAKKNIQVTTVIPGLMRTGSHVNAQFKGSHRAEYAWFSILGALPISSTDAGSAARQIVEAIRFAQPHLTITLPARWVEIANTLFPNVTAAGFKLFNQLLPSFEAGTGDQKWTGWESQSEWSPSMLTALSDEAVSENNELRQHVPIL